MTRRFRPPLLLMSRHDQERHNGERPSDGSHSHFRRLSVDQRVRITLMAVLQIVSLSREVAIDKVVEERLCGYANDVGLLRRRDRAVDRRRARQFSAGIHARRTDQRGGLAHPSPRGAPPLEHQLSQASDQDPEEARV